MKKWAIYSTILISLAVLLYSYYVRAERDFAKWQRAAHDSANVKQLVLGLHTHHDGRKSFPSQGWPSGEESPRLSWRARIVPFIESSSRNQQIDFDKPWNTEPNRSFVPACYGVFQTSGAIPRGMANILAVVGDDTVIDPLHASKLTDITDGLDSTIVLVEVAPEHAVPWNKPADYTPDPSNPAAGLGLPDRDFFIAGFADGSVRYIPKSIDPATLNALFTKSGGEQVDLSMIE